MKMLTIIIFITNPAYITGGLLLALAGALIVLFGTMALRLKKPTPNQANEIDYYDDFDVEDDSDRENDEDSNDETEIKTNGSDIIYEENQNEAHVSARLTKSTTWKYNKLTACSFAVKGAGLRQQDSFRLPPDDLNDIIDEKGALFILCDGMGTPTQGAIASNGCSNTLSDAFYGIESIKSTPHFLHDILPALDSHVRKMVGEDPPTGTTLVCSIIKNDELYLGSVGNSRLYVIRNDSMYQITKDHTYYQDLEKRVRAGTLTLEEAKTHPRRDELTSYLGIGKLKTMQVNSQPIGLVAGDIVLMCSEGVYKQLSYEKIQTILSMPGSLEEARMELYNAIDKIPEETRIDSTGILIGYDFS